MSKDNQKIGRIAMRKEGDVWMAYYAMPGTMDGALFLGSLHMGFASDPEHKHSFMTLIRACVSDIIYEKTGLRPTWNAPKAAPEIERGGNA